MKWCVMCWSKENSYFRYFFPSLSIILLYTFGTTQGGGKRVDARYTHAQGTSPPGTHLLKVDTLPTLQTEHIFAISVFKTTDQNTQATRFWGSFNFEVNKGEPVKGLLLLHSCFYTQRKVGTNKFTFNLTNTFTY